MNLYQPFRRAKGRIVGSSSSESFDTDCFSSIWNTKLGFICNLFYMIIYVNILRLINWFTIALYRDIFYQFIIIYHGFCLLFFFLYS